MTPMNKVLLFRADLIDQVDSLMEKMDTAQVLRVLSLANRIFVTEDPDPAKMESCTVRQ